MNILGRWQMRNMVTLLTRMTAMLASLDCAADITRRCAAVFTREADDAAADREEAAPFAPLAPFKGTSSCSSAAEVRRLLAAVAGAFSVSPENGMNE